MFIVFIREKKPLSSKRTVKNHKYEILYPICPVFLMKLKKTQQPSSEKFSYHD